LRGILKVSAGSWHALPIAEMAEKLNCPIWPIAIRGGQMRKFEKLPQSASALL